MELNGFIEMLLFDVKTRRFRNRFKAKLCDRCKQHPCEYITLQVAGENYPTFDFWCQNCLTKHDFEDTINMGIEVSKAYTIKISTGKCGYSDEFEN
jgi:hypothetical protein